MRTCMSKGYLSKFMLQMIVSFICIEETTKIESEVKYDCNRDVDVDAECGFHDDTSTAPEK